MPTLALANYILTTLPSQDLTTLTSFRSPTSPNRSSSPIDGDTSISEHAKEDSHSDRKPIRRLERQRSRLITRYGPTEVVNIARRLLAREFVRKSEVAALQACSKRELTRAKRAARLPRVLPFIDIGKGIENSDDEIVIITDELRDTELHTFPGKVVIQDRPEAIKQAIAEHSRHSPLRKEPGRHSYYVDASMTDYDSLAGIAVAYKTDRKFWASKWAVKGYSIQTGSYEADAEAWAIWKALEIVLEKARVDDSLETPLDPCSLAIIYSDCQFTLRDLRDGESTDIAVTQKIISQTQDLKLLGVKVELHWVPGHRNVPGNYLADFVAKQAFQAGR